MQTLRGLVTRLAMAGLVSAVSAAVIVAGALGWSSGTSCGSTYWICVSKDDGNGAPKAVTGASDSTYVGDVYPNTTDSINNSVSSVKNASSNKDVTFHHDVNNSGTAYCQDSGTQRDDLGWFGFGDDDHFSSHQAGADDLAC